MPTAFWAVILLLIEISILQACDVPEKSLPIFTWRLSGESKEIKELNYVEDSFKQLQKITSKVLVVSIAGPAREGKSSLLNILAHKLTKKKPFEVGNTVKTQTEEVFVFAIPECASPIPGTAIFLIDSPGLFATNRIPMFDAQVMVALNLISSLYLYYSPKIDRTSLEQINDAVTAAKSFKFIDHNDQVQSITHPDLLWILKNFLLEFKIDGNTISPRDHLISMLKDVDKVMNSTLLNDFEKSFASMDVLPLPFPTENSNTAKINEMDPDSFSQEFKDTIDKIVEKIKLTQPKKIGELYMTPSNFEDLIKHWIKVINIPLQIPLSMRELSDKVMELEIEKAVLKYKELMSNNDPPSNSKKVMELHEQAVKNVLVYDSPTFIARVNNQINAIFSELNTQRKQEYENWVKNKIEELDKNILTSAKDRLSKLQYPQYSFMIAETMNDLNIWKHETENYKTDAETLVESHRVEVEQKLRELTEIEVVRSKEMDKTVVDNFEREVEKKLLGAPVATITDPEILKKDYTAWFTKNHVWREMDEKHFDELDQKMRATLEGVIKKALNSGPAYFYTISTYFSYCFGSLSLILFAMTDRFAPCHLLVLSAGSFISSLFLILRKIYMPFYIASNVVHMFIAVASLLCGIFYGWLWKNSKRKNFDVVLPTFARPSFERVKEKF